MKKTKKARSVFAVLLAIVLLLVVASTIFTHVLFSNDKLPAFAGYHLYLHETEDMEPDIPQNSLVLAKDAPNASITPGNKVLCYLSDGTLALRVIYQVTVNEDGTSSYYPGTALDQGSELTIPRANIFALCEWQSKDLYKYIKFATSVGGIMLLLVVPCIILILMILAKIAKSGKEDLNDEDFLFNEMEELEVMTRKPKNADNPLFEPNHAPPAGESLERKKSSISENFERKPVNENSPYQKAVQERTMKFRIQQQNIDEAKRQEDAGHAQMGTQVFSAQKVEEAAKQQVPEASFTKPLPAPGEPAAHMPAPAAPMPEPAAPAPAPAPKKPAAPPRPVTPAPNIDDIINPSELRAAKTGQKINPEIAASGSIDDLLRVLEAEKKKL